MAAQPESHPEVLFERVTAEGRSDWNITHNGQQWTGKFLEMNHSLGKLNLLFDGGEGVSELCEGAIQQKMLFNVEGKQYLGNTLKVEPMEAPDPDGMVEKLELELVLMADPT